MKVHVPGPLRSYTGGSSIVDARGTSVIEVLWDLNRQFPGMRFRMIDEQDRIRQHIRLFVNQDLVGDLKTSLKSNDELQIICAISGGKQSSPALRPLVRGWLQYFEVSPIREMGETIWRF